MTVAAAVVGTGFIGPVHVEALLRAGVPVAGILGSTSEKSRAAAERQRLAKAYASFEELLADPDVGCVHITTPNRFHFDMASRALRAGKHVMCEKPLAMTAAESAALVRLARESGRAAAVTYNLRFYPLCLEAAARMGRGDIGELNHVAGCYVQDWLFKDTDYNWRVLASEGGELRAVADIGTHWLDMVQCITGKEIDAVCADLLTVIPTRQRAGGSVETFKGKQAARPAHTEPVPIDTEDFGALMLRFRGGGRGSLWVSQVTAGRKNCVRWEIAGTKGSLAWNSEVPNELWIGHRDAPNEMLIRDPALMSERAAYHADSPGGHNEGYADTFKQCFRAFYDAIARGDYNEAPTFPSFADGHWEIVLCEAILRSHREGRWVEIERETT